MKSSWCGWLVHLYSVLEIYSSSKWLLAFLWLVLLVFFFFNINMFLSFPGSILTRNLTLRGSDIDEFILASKLHLILRSICYILHLCLVNVHLSKATSYQNVCGLFFFFFFFPKNFEAQYIYMPLKSNSIHPCLQQLNKMWRQRLVKMQSAVQQLTLSTPSDCSFSFWEKSHARLCDPSQSREKRHWFVVDNFSRSALYASVYLFSHYIL